MTTYDFAEWLWDGLVDLALKGHPVATLQAAHDEAVSRKEAITQYLKMTLECERIGALYAEGKITAEEAANMVRKVGE